MIDPPPHRRGPWYAEGLNFECRRCGRCCGGEPGYVWVTAAELLTIARYLAIDVAALKASCVRRVGRRLSLREQANGDCVFFEAGCVVYPVRPAQCRTFPFWPEHLRTRAAWERLGRVECPGVGRGRRWSREQIDLLAGRGRPRRRAASAALARALAGLEKLYAELDAHLAPAMATCRSCGVCCDFTLHDHVLYVTELERALLEARRGRGHPAVAPGRCPYQAGALCSVRDARPLGCRTFFCHAEAGARGRAAHEEFYRRMAPLREASGLPLDYAPLVGGAPRGTGRRDERGKNR